MNELIAGLVALAGIFGGLFAWLNRERKTGRDQSEHEQLRRTTDEEIKANEQAAKARNAAANATDDDNAEWLLRNTTKRPKSDGND